MEPSPSGQTQAYGQIPMNGSLNNMDSFGTTSDGFTSVQSGAADQGCAKSGSFARDSGNDGRSNGRDKIGKRQY